MIADADGRVVAAVPRTRTRVDSGVSIAGRTVHDPELEETAAAVARAIGLVGVANVQLRRDRDGRPALLEVNPRFPGALPLTIAAGVDIPSLVVDLFTRPRRSPSASTSASSRPCASSRTSCSTPPRCSRRSTPAHQDE